MHGSSELAQLYQSESSVEVKKQIIQAMFVGGDADKLIELAKTEKDPELRKTAIRNLGMMKRAGTTEALTGIYASDASLDVKKAVVNALFIQSNATALVTLARDEKNPEMKKDIVSKLSIMKSKEATDYLMELLEVSSHECGCEVRRARCCVQRSGSGFSVLGSGFGAAPRLAQGRIIERDHRRRGPSRRGSTREVRARRRAPASAWIGYRMPMVAGPAADVLLRHDLRRQRS